jgi:hypothetical protein
MLLRVAHLAAWAPIAVDGGVGKTEECFPSEEVSGSDQQFDMSATP